MGALANVPEHTIVRLQNRNELGNYTAVADGTTLVFAQQTQALYRTPHGETPGSRNSCAAIVQRTSSDPVWSILHPAAFGTVAALGINRDAFISLLCCATSSAGSSYWLYCERAQMGLPK
ncbi:hypothetical protein CAC42_5959 [Sphaceloma murrayae]|uniref:Uncharacterized protein n=1 Tax=Sphaceloma murrayae TaxID=2082308 RepID=A0A2K1QZP8_9PEZI|nr:hypothetical protein CAC42_5959 [Sphaceloma murrayae]